MILPVIELTQRSSVTNASPLTRRQLVNLVKPFLGRVGGDRAMGMICSRRARVESEMILSGATPQDCCRSSEGGKEGEDGIEGRKLKGSKVWNRRDTVNGS